MTASDGAPGEGLAPFCTPAARPWVLATAILASSMGFIDSSVTAIAMPAIRADLSATLVQAQWVGNAYLLTLSSVILAGGAMGDRFGVVRVFGWGIALFTLASVLCALAPTVGTLIAARAFKGLAAALMVPSSMAIIGRAFPEAARGRALGLWAAASAITTALGPVVGGLVLDRFGDGSWRIIFAANLPFGMLCLWMLYARIAPDAGRPGTPVDWPGAALATLGLGALAYGMTGGAWIWAGAGLGLIAAFVGWEARAPAPMLRLGLFRDSAFAAANLATFFLYFALTAVMFFLPMTAIAAWGVSPSQVALAYLPTSILIGGMSGPVGRLADRTGAAPLVALGAAIVAAGYAWLGSGAVPGDFWWHALPAMALAAFGMGLVVAPLTAAVMAAAGPAEQGAASGINNAVARVASLSAVALMGQVAMWGFAAAGGDPATGFAGSDVAATAAGFAAVAGFASGCAALAAAIMALAIRRNSGRS
jgi:EmrB/QacA subfamily drug resistance transporter